MPKQQVKDTLANLLERGLLYRGRIVESERAGCVYVLTKTFGGRVMAGQLSGNEFFKEERSLILTMEVCISQSITQKYKLLYGNKIRHFIPEAE